MTQVSSYPKDWQEVKLGELLDYEQPGPYIVNNENYNDSYKVPVLTAGKSFILGYTNEENGIYKDVPVIIFDDFTRDSRYIDFSFKVKSSAIKMLKLKNKDDNLKFLFEKLQMINFQVAEHKRNWISTYANLKILIPKDPAEQTAIAQILTSVDNTIQKTDELIKQTETLKKGLMSELLTKGIGHKKFKQTEWGEIPEDWEIKKIRNISNTFAGGTPARENKDYYGDDIYWVKSGEVFNKYIDITEEKISDLGLKSSAAKIVPKDSVLVALYGATAGKVGILKINAATNQAVLAIPNDNKEFDTYFLYTVLSVKTEYLLSITQGSGQPNLSKQLIDNLKIALPPLPEQHQISEILSAVDKEIDELKTKKNHYEKIKKGLMSDLLSGKVRVKVN